MASAKTGRRQGLVQDDIPRSCARCDREHVGHDRGEDPGPRDCGECPCQGAEIGSSPDQETCDDKNQHDSDDHSVARPDAQTRSAIAPAGADAFRSVHSRTSRGPAETRSRFTPICRRGRGASEAPVQKLGSPDGSPPPSATATATWPQSPPCAAWPRLPSRCGSREHPSRTRR